MPHAMPNIPEQVVAYNYGICFLDLLGQRAIFRGEGWLPPVSSDTEHKRFFATLLLALIAPHLLLYKRPPLDTSYTQEGLAGTDIVCAPFDQALTATYVAYWQKSKYLPMPSEQPPLS